MYLSRCSSAPLDVEISLEQHVGLEDAPVLSDLVARATSLIISHWPRLGSQNASDSPTFDSFGDARAIRSILDILRALSATELVELSIDLQSKPGPHDFGTPIFVSPYMFNQEPLQRLQTVKLNLVRMRRPFIWPSLRCLELTESRAWTHIESFVALFENVPLLEECTSYNDSAARDGGVWGNTIPVENLPPLRSLPMKHLKILKLHGFYRDMFLALAILDIPHTALASLTLSGISLAYNAEIKQRIMHDAVQAHFSVAAQAGTYFDCVAFHGRKMSATQPLPDGAADDLPPSFTLSIPLHEYTDNDPRNELQVLETLFAYPIFTRAPTLTIQSHAKCGIRGEAHRLDGFYLDELSYMLELYAHVQSLNIIGEDVCACVGNVIIPQGQALPKLTVLRMRGARFDSGTPHKEGFVSTHLLISCLLRHGEVFKLLELEECKLGEGDVRRLKEGLDEGRLSLVDCEIEALDNV